MARFLALRPRLIAALAVSFLACASLCAAADYPTSGSYTDSSGTLHRWSIDDSHALYWNSSPYVPAGVAFSPAYVYAEPTEANLTSDVSALNKLKDSGISEVLITGPKPISATEPASLQAILTKLDSLGFTYGIELRDDPVRPLTGAIVTPGTFRMEGPSSDRLIERPWNRSDSAVYVVFDKVRSVLVDSGTASTSAGKLSIDLGDPLGETEVLIVYPTGDVASLTGTPAGDIWGGYGEMRDRILSFFSKVKLGPGMRFLLEPFTSKMDFADEVGGFIPTSNGFRLGFEAYLTKKHVTDGVLNAAWGLNESPMTFEEASRLVPLWYEGRGVPYVYEPVSGRFIHANSSLSRIWSDLADYRYKSTMELLNAIADVLKRNVADVPVVLRCSRFHKNFATPFGIGGFDGLMADPAGNRADSATEVCGAAYSLAEECAKTTWYLATAGQGHLSSELAPGSVDAAGVLESIGCKGFFLSEPYTHSSDADSIADAAIERVTALGRSLRHSRRTAYRPQIILYPAFPPTGASTQRLDENSWWLPTLRPGKSSYIGDGLFAYSVAGTDRVCMWSQTGKVKLTFPLGGRAPVVDYPAGAAMDQRGGVFSVGLDKRPMVIRGADLNLMFPLETAERSIQRLAKLIPAADKLSHDVRAAREVLDKAKTVLKNRQALIAYGMTQSAISQLLTATGADIWIEGDQAAIHNFTRVAARFGASGGLLLNLDTDLDPVMSHYTATYSLENGQNSSYEIWLAGTPPSESSPISYSVDETPWIPVDVKPSDVDMYAPGLGWYKIGSTNLFPGKHSFRLRIDRKRDSDQRYSFGLDAIVFSPRAFSPDGVTKPF